MRSKKNKPPSLQRKSVLQAKMEAVKRENIDVKKSVIVSGLTLSDPDQELEACLMKYGSIKRNIIIDDPNSEHHHSAIVEFSYESAMHNLESALPMTITSTVDTNIVFHVRSLGSVYTPAVDSSVTEGYLENLKAIAQASGKTLQEALQYELQKISTLMFPEKESSVSEPELEQPVNDSNMHTREAENPAKESAPAPSYCHMRSPDASVSETMSFNIPTSTLNPPGIQRVVMEHVVRTNDSMSSSHIAFRLKVFSGRIPRPSHEPDFDTWRASVDFLLNDQSLSDLHKTGKILDSLLPPASDVVKHISPHALPSHCLKVLESVYGSVEDGDELFAKFIGALQNQGEKPSTYLHRLHVMLSTAIRRGGIAEAERNRCLLKQFCRGCWDNNLIADLQLEGKKDAPPSFAEFVVLIRTAEDKQSLKEERMRKHLGLNRHAPAPLKLRPVTHQQSAYCTDISGEPNDELQSQLSTKQKSVKSKSKVEKSEVESLKKEVAKLQAQITMMKTEPVRKEKSPKVDEISELRQKIAELQAHLVPRFQGERQEKSPALSTFPVEYRPKPREPELNKNPRPTWQSHNRPRPGYCFHCGEDGHLAVDCENDANPRKVDEKRRELRERQAKWDLQNAFNSKSLN